MSYVEAATTIIALISYTPKKTLSSAHLTLANGAGHGVLQCGHDLDRLCEVCRCAKPAVLFPIFPAYSKALPPAGLLLSYRGWGRKLSKHVWPESGEVRFVCCFTSDRINVADLKANRDTISKATNEEMSCKLRWAGQRVCECLALRCEAHQEQNLRHTAPAVLARSLSSK